MIAAVPAREDPADAWIGAGVLARRRARGRPGRHRQPAPPRPAARRPARPAGRASCTATSTPGCASSPRASSTRSCSPPPACGGWGARTRSPSRSRPSAMTPAAGQGALVLQIRAGDEAAPRGRGGDRRRDGAARADRRARRRRPARGDLRDPDRRPRPGRRRAARRSRPSSASPTAASGSATGSRARPSEPAAAGALLAERLLGAGARDILDRAEDWMTCRVRRHMAVNSTRPRRARRERAGRGRLPGRRRARATRG